MPGADRAADEEIRSTADGSSQVDIRRARVEMWSGASARASASASFQLPRDSSHTELVTCGGVRTASPTIQAHLSWAVMWAEEGGERADRVALRRRVAVPAAAQVDREDLVGRGEML